MSLNLKDLEVFCRVAETASFTTTAQQLDMAKGRVSVIVKSLEREVGRRLLQRTTRSVRLTSDGLVFLERCKNLLQESDQLVDMFRPSSQDMRGSVRVDMPSLFAQEVVMPRLPELLAKYPQLDLGISINDRRVNMVQEGIDCLVRIGPLPDSDLMVRKIGMMSVSNLASPMYLSQFGVPRKLSDLSNHRMIHFTNNIGREEALFRYAFDGEVRTISMQSSVTLNSGSFLQKACLDGLGIIQMSKSTNKDFIKSGKLIEILPDFTPPPVQISLLYPHSSKLLAPRVESVINWIVQTAQASLT